MARGSDARAAAAEFRSQYGVQGNAEDLIQANRSAYPAELRAAQLATVDEKASADLDRGKVEKGLDLPEGGSLLDAKVRGKYIVAVVETPSGHTYKEVLSADGKDLPESSGTSDQGVAEASSLATQQIFAAQQEAERIIAEARDKAQEEASKTAQDAMEQMRDEAKKIAKENADTLKSQREKAEKPPKENADKREKAEREKAAREKAAKENADKSGAPSGSGSGQ